MPSTSRPLSLPGMGRNGARCSSSARSSRRSVPCVAERRGAVRDRRRPRVRGPAWAARRPRGPGCGRGPDGWPGRSTLASRRSAFSPLCLALIRVRRRLCEPTAHRKCPLPGEALDVGLLVGVLAGEVDEVGQPEARLLGVPAGRIRVVGDQPLDRRRLVAGDPQHRAVAAHRGEVGVGLGRACVVPEAQRDRSFHRHAASVAARDASDRVRCPARRGAGRVRRRPRGRRGRVRSGRRSGARTR